MGFNSPSPLLKVRPWVLGSFLLLQVLGQVEVKPEPRTQVRWCLHSAKSLHCCGPLGSSFTEWENGVMWLLNPLPVNLGCGNTRQGSGGKALQGCVAATLVCPHGGVSVKGLAAG